jgi:hypothetical protein
VQTGVAITEPDASTFVFGGGDFKRDRIADL